MTNKLRYATALAALLSVSGCGISHEQAMLNRGCHTGESADQCTVRIDQEKEAAAALRHAKWREANCQAAETDHDCVGRLSVALEASVSMNPSPARQRADEAECQMMRSQTYQMHDAARPTLLGLEAIGWANQTYQQCMEMKAAQRNAY